jgi:hypothetical protein
VGFGGICKNRRKGGQKVFMFKKGYFSAVDLPFYSRHHLTVDCRHELGQKCFTRRKKIGGEFLLFYFCLSLGKRLLKIKI